MLILIWMYKSITTSDIPEANVLGLQFYPELAWIRKVKVK